MNKEEEREEVNSMNKDLSSITSQRIKDLRIMCGYTMEELAAKMGVTKSTIAKWENGYVDTIKMQKISKLANIFGVSPTYILGFDEPNKENIEREKSKEERFILLYRQLPGEQKKLIDNMLETLASK